jgi:hypothetical protein
MIPTMTSSTSTLPPDFLRTPAVDIRASKIDFATSTLPEYRDLYAVVIDGVLSSTECEQLIQAAEATTNGTWERAMVNVGMGQQRLIADLRNCGRIIWDSKDVVDRIWSRIGYVAEVQEIMRLVNVPKIVGYGPVKRKEVWAYTRPNERMRFLKYTGGEYFYEHEDGTYVTPDGLERSYFTLHLYLSDVAANNGGATTFHAMSMVSEKDVKVTPKLGRILLFQHRGLLHSGEEVTGGTKFTMRTDLMYKIEDSSIEN